MSTIANNASSSSSSTGTATTSAADTKISNDLIILKERMDLLESMLNPPDAASPKLSVLTNDALRSVIGYLDACGPRMIELVTALCTSTTGSSVLSEEVFGDVLACNDRLQKLLLDVDTRTLTETPASTTVASAASNAASDNSAGAALDVDALDSAAVSERIISEQFGDLLLGNEDPFAEAHASGAGGGGTANVNAATGGVGVGVAAAGAKTTGETSDDFDSAAFDDFTHKPAPAPMPTATVDAAAATTVTETAPAAATAAAKVDDDDPFDDFFAERTTPS